MQPEYIKRIRNAVLNDVASKLARIPEGPDGEKEIDMVIRGAIDTLDTEDMQR
jgi:hypothetical protein